MTTTPKPTGRSATVEPMSDTDLKVRLRKKRQAMPVLGGGTISLGGEASHYITDDGMRLINPDGPEAATEIERLEGVIEGLRGALEPFANVATRIRSAAQDDRWLEKILFYMGDDSDPTKWSLSGRAFDRAREAHEAALTPQTGGEGNG